LKNGDAPYEDEKFTYIAFTKAQCGKAAGRIRRHPRIEPGKITLELCTASGLTSKVYTKKDKEMFKKARKSDCNDEI
jgi:ribosomal protein RSM22 (predicted rRNA methylase)